MFNPSIYRQNRRRFYGAVDMSLSTVLTQLLHRAQLNSGKVQKETLERGLTVAFLTKNGVTKMQISRPKPSSPSEHELVACLQAINQGDAISIQLQDEKNNYLQVVLPNQGHNP